jgi:hypothetical protein
MNRSIPKCLREGACAGHASMRAERSMKTTTLTVDHLREPDRFRASAARKPRTIIGVGSCPVPGSNHTCRRAVGHFSVQLIRSRGFAQHVLANRLEECRSSWPVDRADAGPSPTLLTPPPDGVSPGAFRRNDFSREPAGIENERIIR